MRFLKKRSLIFLIIVAFAAFSGPSSAQANPQPKDALLDKGSVAPGFTLENVNEEKVSLKDFKGSVFVLGLVFGDKAAHDMENYRKRLSSDFKGKKIKLLKVVQVNKPFFITKEFIRSKMKKQAEYNPVIPKLTLIDWGGTLELDTKYGIKNKELPTLYIIGKKGEVLFALQGWFNEANLSKLKQELRTILSDSSGHTQSKNFRIGVTQIATHFSLDRAQKGFKTALQEEGYIEGKNVVFDRQNAQGNVEKNNKIAQKFIKDKVDMIHIMSSPCAELLVEKITKIPIVFSVVINPVEGGVIPTLGPSGTNVTGVGVHVCPLAEQWPVISQFEMYHKFIPNARKWGTIYNSNSANSKYHIKEIKETGQQLGVEIVAVPVTQAAEIKKAAESLVGKVDAVYITSDEITMSDFEVIAKVCNQNKMPLFGGELKCVSKGAVAAYNQDYFLTGYKAGKKAARILKGEKPGTIPSELTKMFYLVISLKNAELQGTTIPEELQKKADKIL